VSDLTPTRSAAIGLKEERRAMQEGYVFLDEKCLLLAAAMLRELRRYDQAGIALRTLLAQAGAALAAAVGRHGLQELQCHTTPHRAPGSDPGSGPGLRPLGLQTRPHSLMGVVLVDATATRETLRVAEPVYPSPEAEACREAFGALTVQLATVAAMSGNLERLHREYRKSVRRVRALQDVLLPELDRDLYEIEAQLDELERDEALGARWGRRGLG
jgi:V/A-type H+-transporting ATPase subunit D